MEPIPPSTPADAALSILFRKLHPLLEDAAHLLDRGAPAADLLKLHGRLQRARERASDLLDGLAPEVPDPALAEALDTLAANLTPMGEPLQQSLVLTQLCLEEAPADLLPHTPPGSVAGSSWGPRMVAFLARLQDPAFQARARWSALDPDLGEEAPAEG